MAITVPEALKNDQLWEFGTYRKALYLTELAWFDCKDLQRDLLGGRFQVNSSVVLAQLRPILRKDMVGVSEKTMLVFTYRFRVCQRNAWLVLSWSPIVR